jgi:small-conductance mechanosensitive channel
MDYFLFVRNINFDYSFLGNTIGEYSIAFIAFVALTVVFRFFQWRVLKRIEVLAKRTKTDIDDTLIQVVRSLKPAFYYVIAFYFAIQYLSFQHTFNSIIDGVVIVVIAYQIVMAFSILIDYTLRKRAEREGKDEQKAYKFLGSFIKWGLWIIAILAVISNFGINITSLIAGLGIGGIAIALAMQNILSDLFSSFAIYFDKPFEVGDFISVGENSGTVEKIGIKTTRLRALQGEEIVISNQELTKSRIQNLKKMKERRATLTFGIAYETPLDKVKAIPEIVKKIFQELGTASVKFDRAHFKSLGASSLDFEVVYYVPTSEYLDYMNIQQQLNLKLMDEFKKEKIEFAYPTQTIYIAKQ